MRDHCFWMLNENFSVAGQLNYKWSEWLSDLKRPKTRIEYLLSHLKLDRHVSWLRRLLGVPSVETAMFNPGHSFKRKPIISVGPDAAFRHPNKHEQADAQNVRCPANRDIVMLAAVKIDPQWNKWLAIQFRPDFFLQHGMLRFNCFYAFAAV
jgi:hypothetical protein